jgi:hypothetical protein
MPTVKELVPVINDICLQIKDIPGVNSVYIWGSYAENLSNPNYVVKDVDVIASTTFNSGDLLAIDNGQYSALRMKLSDLEDEGFDPRTVAFTKRFLAFDQYNVDHWATSSDNKLLHWGAIPDNQDDWRALHEEAERQATKLTGYKRADLRDSSEPKRKEWNTLTTGIFPNSSLMQQDGIHPNTLLMTY